MNHVRELFREYVRPYLHSSAVFFSGMTLAWALVPEWERLWVASLIITVLLIAWDGLLTKAERKSHLEELKEFYRSEFETERFGPVKIVTENTLDKDERDE